jgi:uncharacterized protein (DUF1330 family)
MASKLSDEVTYGTVDEEYAARLEAVTPEEDGPVWMVNLMKYRDVAVYEDGRPSTISGAEADALYAPFAIFKELGASLVLYAEVEATLLGDDQDWDAVAVVNYPSRRAFMEMQDRPDYLERHAHKAAGMERTIILCCTPMDLPIATPEFPRASFASAPNPSTPEDPAILVCHVVQLANEGAGAEDFNAYSAKAAKVGFAQGVRIDGWFDVEGTPVGDGRHWDQVRFNAFPSRAAFMAVVNDPERKEAHVAHREVAMSDTYTMILRPLIDTLGSSVGSDWS